MTEQVLEMIDDENQEQLDNEKSEELNEVELQDEIAEEAEVLPEEKEPEISINDIPGVGPSTAEKLIEAGFDSVISIAVATIGELVDAVGVSETVARKMINFCRNEANMGFETGNEVFTRRQRVLKVKTGATELDNLLDGGFETGAIVECFGEFGSAKTQIGHVLCVQVQKQFPGAYAVYIDTEKTFRPERIIQLAQGAGLDPDETLNHIKVAKAYNSDHQMLLAEKVEELITKQNLPVKVVVVDSLTSQFRSEFVGRGTLAGRQQKINKHMATLSKLADLHNTPFWRQLG